ncbi:MAG: biopolymer transporter ExbD [Taibaiella sp.]|jgi:biopolymer transport protein ExbD
MAEIEVKGGKKGAPRIDLTPMVDLGFLLITFFMFTTTMSKPKAMEIQMPFKDDQLKEEDKNKIKNDEALTLLLSKDHRIYYYNGIGDDPTKPPVVEVTYFKDKDGIRDVLINKKKTVQSLISQGVLNAKDKAIVLIKPDENSTTEDLINILDEMTINAIPVYAVVDITPVDKDFIKATEAANPQ